MKKLLLLLTVLLASQHTFAQYQPLAADSTLWRESAYVQGGPGPAWGNLILGDTLVNGQSYFKLYRLDFVGYTPYTTSQRLIALIREAQQKVYLRPTDSNICSCPPGVESLIYDFDVANGDSVYTKLILLENDSVPFYVVRGLQLYNLGNGRTNYAHEYGRMPLGDMVQHGQGRFRGLLKCIRLDNLEYPTSDARFYRGSEILEWYFPVGMADKELHSYVKVYPNPATERLFIGGLSELQFPLTVVLHDLQGRRVLEQVLDVDATQQGIALAQLPAGMYVLQISNAQGQYKMGSFVKQ